MGGTGHRLATETRKHVALWCVCFITRLCVAPTSISACFLNHLQCRRNAQRVASAKLREVLSGACGLAEQHHGIAVERFKTLFVGPWFSGASRSRSPMALSTCSNSGCRVHESIHQKSMFVVVVSLLDVPNEPRSLHHSAANKITKRKTMRLLVKDTVGGIQLLCVHNTCGYQDQKLTQEPTQANLNVSSSNEAATSPSLVIKKGSACKIRLVKQDHRHLKEELHVSISSVSKCELFPVRS